MSYKKVNRVIGLFVLFLSFLVYTLTLQPSFSFWDGGELLASSFSLLVPHSPGFPLYNLIGRIFTILPFSSDFAVRLNLLSVFSASFTIMLVYFISTKLIKEWKGEPKNNSDILFISGSSLIGALAFAFSESFWFSSSIAGVNIVGNLLLALCIYLVFLWWEKSDENNSDKYLLLVMYLIGLSFGINSFLIFIIPIIGLIYYFKRFDYSFKSFLIAIAANVFITVLIFWLIAKKYPQILSWNLLLGLLIFLLIIVLVIVYLIRKNNKTILFAILSIFLLIIGYSTYFSVLQRSSVPNLPINYTNPSKIELLAPYIENNQFNINSSIWQRRYSQDPQFNRTWDKYTGNIDFMWKFQINEMFNRYLFWQYIGKAGNNLGDGFDYNKFYAIPFLIGIIGMFYQFRKNWKMGFVILLLFFITSIIAVIFLNLQDPQSREKDYYFIPAFMIFSVWISIGIAALINQIIVLNKGKGLIYLSIIIIILGLVFIPGNMFRVNYQQQSKVGNSLAFNYAYNVLQSVEKDAILFTSGDNDTYPLLCLQTVYGIRHDVRIINIPLAQNDWYNLQLKNESPFGSLPVPMSFSDEQLKNANMVKLESAGWDERKLIELDVPVNEFTDSIKGDNDYKNKIEFKIPVSIYQKIGNDVVSFLKISDYILLDIVKSNNWNRPINFSLGVTDDNCLGLGDYLELQGLTMRLVPHKTKDINNPNNTPLNKDFLKVCLMNSAERINISPQPGMIFKGLNDKNLIYDNNEQRIVESYRTLFLKLATELTVDSSNFNEARSVLNRMENIIPRNIIKIDYRLEYEIAMLYYKIGDLNKFNDYADGAEITIRNEVINKKNFDAKSYYNPYRILLDIYDVRADYKSAMNILDQLSRDNPNDASIIQKIETIKQKMAGGKNKKEDSGDLDDENNYNEMP
jgi:hypothetical protein